MLLAGCVYLFVLPRLTHLELQPTAPVRNGPEELINSKLILFSSNLT